jgi:protein-glutamine gamma-glutamyltransferase
MNVLVSAERRRAVEDLFDAARRPRLGAALLWTTAALLGGMLLHVDRVPFWVNATALVCVTWRLAAQWRVIGLPSRYAKVGVAMMLIAAVLLRFHTLNGLSAGTALLVVMGSIKLLETHTRRDRYVLIGSTLFLLLAACLDRQSLLRAPLYALEAWLCCTALAMVADEGGGLTSRAGALLAARSLAISVPLALVLFLFFPRMVGAFWVLPPADAAVTGLGNTMTPGGISSLSESDDPAFRVRFAGATPPPEERYWRGPVLHQFDGYTWSRGYGYYRQPTLQREGRPYRYHITLEPTAQRYWFALDTVSAYPTRRAMLTFDYQLIGNDPITRPTSYEATSYTHNASAGSASALARRYETQLPPNRNPRARQLAREMYAKEGSDAAYVRAVLDLFRRGGFEYTLTPPRLDLDSVDDFLFNTRRGFCGHYASAFVMLMRAAHVPARVVTGYQGGEWNPIREYFVVRQSDAHAWAEVWLEGQGWTRIDPTAAVAPERLRRGVFDLMPDALSAPERFLRDTPWLHDARQRWDALNDWWNERVVRFDFNTQVDLLRWMGIEAPDWQKLGWLFAAGLIGWLLFVSWHVSKALRVTPMDRLARAYTRLCAKLAKAGAPRASHEGPLAYADVVAARRPEAAATVRALLRRYAELRYGPGGASDLRTFEIGTFERAVRHFRVPRRARAP